MIVDASAMLAVFLGEQHAAWAAAEMNRAQQLEMSTVNLTEVLIILRDRTPQTADAIERKLLASPIRFVSPDVNQALVATAARLRFPLNLGDCFAYALAMTMDEPLLAVDGDFAKTDARAILPETHATKGRTENK